MWARGTYGIVGAMAITDQRNGHELYITSEEKKSDKNVHAYNAPRENDMILSLISLYSTFPTIPFYRLINVAFQ